MAERAGAGFNDTSLNPHIYITEAHFLHQGRLTILDHLLDPQNMFPGSEKLQMASITSVASECIAFYKSFETIFHCQPHRCGSLLEGAALKTQVGTATSDVVDGRPTAEKRKSSHLASVFQS